MNKDLTSSPVARQNVLNNSYVLGQLEIHLALGGLKFEGETIFTKSQAAEQLGVDERTIDRYLSSYAQELESNGYRVVKGKVLKNINLAYVDDTNVADIIDPKAPSL